MRNHFRLEYAACLILLVALADRSTAQPPQQPLLTTPDTSGLQTRLMSLQNRGAAEVLPAEQYLAVRQAVSSVSNWTSLAKATKSLDTFEAAFVDIAAQEAGSGREACIRLDREMRHVEKLVAGGAGCDGLPDTVNDLRIRLSELRSFAYAVEGNGSVALQVQRLANDATRDVNDVVAAAAVCGTVTVDSGNAALMLETAGRMAQRKATYGTAVRLYARIIEGSPGTEAAAAARRRIGIFGPDVQKKLADTVLWAAAACDTELAQQNLKDLRGLMAALSERATDLVDPSIGQRVPELDRLVSAMDAACSPDSVAARENPVPPAIPVPNEVIEIEDLIVNGHLSTAESRIAGLTEGDEKRRLETFFDATKNMAEAQRLLQAGHLDRGIALAERAWLTGLLGRTSNVLADGLCTRAEATLADGRPGDALEDVQHALLAAPISGRAQRVAAAVYARLGMNCLASGNADDALHFFRESILLRDNGEIRLEVARLLAAREQFQEARREAERAEELGVPIDAATHIQVFVLGYLRTGDTETAWNELDKVGTVHANALDALKVHALRLPLSASVGRLAAGVVDARGLIGRGSGVLSFLGSDTSGFKGSLATALSGLSGPGSSGFSEDYRYMAFSGSNGSIVIFDALAGKTAGTAEDGLATSRVNSLAALARAEVIEALAWFLADPIEEALNGDLLKGDRERAVLSALASMVTAGLDYAVLADSRGSAMLVEGSIHEDYETGLQAAFVSAPNTRPVLVGGTPYREVVAPVRIGGSVQAMLVLGVAVAKGDVNRLPRADRLREDPIVLTALQPGREPYRHELAGR